MAQQPKHRTSRSTRPTVQPSRRWWWGGVVGAVLILVAGLAFWQVQGENTSPAAGEDAFPTPIGFPDAAQDVGTLESKPAPAFALPDETGQVHSVNPGEHGQPIVLIFNMGLG